VSRFANVLGDASPSSLRLAWLAGILEGEGTFLRPLPSMPNCPIVACRMTDRDVVERVATEFGTAVMAIDKGKYRTEFAATLKGRCAVELMADIKPLMGERRQWAIDSALGCYRPPARKLDFKIAEEIRRRFRRGESVSSLARDYRVARQTIYPILKGRIYHSQPNRPWRRQGDSMPCVETPSWMSPQELHWLAGWLEGEGSFLAPPPSNPGRPRISGQARDKDVVAEVGRLFQTKPIFDRSGQLRNPAWSAMWRILIQGRRAITLMLALEPLMGQRRQEKIRAAITAAISQSAGRFNAKTPQSPI